MAINFFRNRMIFLLFFFFFSPHNRRYINQANLNNFFSTLFLALLFFEE